VSPHSKNRLLRCCHHNLPSRHIKKTITGVPKMTVQIIRTHNPLTTPRVAMDDDDDDVGVSVASEDWTSLIGVGIDVDVLCGGVDVGASETIDTSIGGSDGGDDSAGEAGINDNVGSEEAENVGTLVGAVVGKFDGRSLGKFVVGDGIVGSILGVGDGWIEGDADGSIVGCIDG